MKLFEIMLFEAGVRLVSRVCVSEEDQDWKDFAAGKEVDLGLCFHSEEAMAAGADPENDEDILRYTKALVGIPRQVRILDDELVCLMLVVVETAERDINLLDLIARARAIGNVGVRIERVSPPTFDPRLN